jgi:nicotinamidase-related amidase
MTEAELHSEVERLHSQGKREEVVALLRRYGIFTDEGDVQEYLRGGDLHPA